MNRRSTLAAALLFALLAGGLPSPVLAQSRARPIQAPHLQGYTLGQRWRSIGRAIPCRDTIIQEVDSVGLLRACFPSTLDQLLFSSDTLVRISSRWPQPYRAPMEAWNSVRGEWVRFWGAPDSVALGVTVDRGQCVLAVWQPSRTRRWSAYVLVEGRSATTNDGETSSEFYAELSHPSSRSRARCSAGW